jgi:hypothetical protein
MHPTPEQMPGSVTQHASVRQARPMNLRRQIGCEFPRGYHGYKDVRQAIAGRRRHVARALLLC